MKSVCVLVFFSFLWNSGPGCPWLVSCAFVFAFVSVVYCSYQVVIFLRAEENVGREKKTDEERNRMASIFLPINPLKMAKIDTTRFGAIATHWEYVFLVLSSCQD